MFIVICEADREQRKVIPSGTYVVCDFPDPGFRCGALGQDLLTLARELRFWPLIFLILTF